MNIADSSMRELPKGRDLRRHAMVACFAAAFGAASAIGAFGAMSRVEGTAAAPSPEGSTVWNVHAMRDIACMRYETLLCRLGMGELARQALVDVLLARHDNTVARLMGLPSDCRWTDRERRAALQLTALAEEYPEMRTQIESVLAELEAFTLGRASLRPYVDAPWWLPVAEATSAGAIIGFENDLNLIFPDKVRVREMERDGALAWRILLGPYETEEEAGNAASLLEASGIAVSRVHPLQAMLVDR